MRVDDTNRRRKPLRLLVPAVAAAVAIVAAGCGSSNNSSSTGNSSGGSSTASSGGSSGGGGIAANSKDPLVIASLVGPAAEGGPDFEYGVQIAAKKINDAGGIMGHKIVVKDFKHDQTVQSAVQSYRTAAADTSVMTAWGGAGGALGIKAASTRQKLPFFGANGTKTLYEPVGPYAFSLSDAGEYGTSGVVWAMDTNPGIKKIAILHDDEEFGLSVADAIKERCTGQFVAAPGYPALPPLGCEVVDEESSTETASVDEVVPQLTKMKNSGADFYYIGCLNVNFAKAARQLGMFNKPIVCDQNLAVPAIAAAGGGASNGMVFGGHKCAAGDAIPTSDPARGWCDEFKKDFTALYPDLPFTNYAVYGSDAVNVFAHAAEVLWKAGKTVTRDNLRAEYEKFDGTFRTSHGLPKSSPEDHRLTGTWTQAYVNLTMHLKGKTPEYTLAPKADPAGAKW